jgi:glutamyl-tRNA synthetase
MHIGNLRTAFYAYALAKHDGGDFILRIEDTDKKRETEGGANEIKELLKIFNINWDEYYVQSERISLYKEAAEKLVASGNAFYCQCEAKNAKEEGYSDTRRDPCRDKNLTSGAVKLKVPEDGKVSFRDYILNEDIEWQASDIFDATLLKTDGFPTYHLASVVDDHEMGITHVLRGHDWMPSTPIHILAYKYLGYELPEIGHLTDILDPEGGKLSKRKGSVSVTGLLKEGYLPEALFNFVILLGWAPKDNRELYTLDEFVKYFDPKGFQKSNPIFNREKLDWFNGYYIRELAIEELTKRLDLEDTPKNRSIVALIHDRIKKLSDFPDLTKFFWDSPTVDVKLLGENHKAHLEKALSAIEESIPLDTVPKDNGFKVGDFFMDLRIAITGTKFTPPINESIEILGKEEAVKRLKKVLE